MSLRLCSGCDRHVRADAACPYCGATEAALVPTDAQGSRSNRLAALAFTSIVVAGCFTSVPMYGAPGALPPEEDAEPSPPPVRPEIPRDASCLSPRVSPVDAAAPSLARGVCDAAAIEALADRLANGTLSAVQPSECAGCAFGSAYAPADAGALLPLGAALSVDVLQPIINTDACIALLIGRGDCALEMGARQLCDFEACRDCVPFAPQYYACTKANASVCGSKARAECVDAVKAASADVAAKCISASAIETFTKVATVLCGNGADGGSAPLDGGRD